MTSRATIAARLHSEIAANVDAYYANAIDHSTFSARNRAIWDRAMLFGVRDGVNAIIRGAEARA